MTKLPNQVATRRKKHSKGMATKSKRARTRTSLIGMTIYQPDLKLSAIGRKLLDALDSMYQRQGPHREQTNGTLNQIPGAWPQGEGDSHTVGSFFDGRNAGATLLCPIGASINMLKQAAERFQKHSDDR
jgi:hypothetical protein